MMVKNDYRAKLPVLPSAFQLAMDAAFLPVLVWDEDGFIVYANQSAEDLWGRKEDALKGRSFADNFSDEAQTLEAEFQMLKANRTWNGRLLVERSDGEEVGVEANLWARGASRAGQTFYVGLLHLALKPNRRRPGLGRWGEKCAIAPRELVILLLMAQGFGDKEMACALGISAPSANAGANSTLRKLQAASRTEAAVRAIKAGLLL